MSTCSYIGVIKEHEIEVLYCHYDGELKFNGAILFNYYNEKKVIELLNRGDMSSLHKNIEEINFDGDIENNKYDSLIELIEELEVNMSIEYVYLYNMKEKKWIFFENYEKPKYFDLETELKRLEIEDNKFYIDREIKKESLN